MRGEGAVMSDGGREKTRLQEPGSFRPDAISRAQDPFSIKCPAGMF